MAFDGAGNLFIADSGNNRIRRIDAATQMISTVAGNGNGVFTGDAGQATAASLATPYGITVDAAGNLFIADTENNRIREVSSASGVITTVAGGGTSTTSIGDGGRALGATLNLPYGVAFDALGNMYIPDSGNNRIRKVDTSGVITTAAGTGVQGAGGDGGAPAAAILYAPSSVAFDVAGNMYIADTQNNRVRKVTNGVINTVFGNGVGKYGGDEGSAIVAGIYGPYFVTLDTAGSLYVADYFDHRIRKVSSNATTLGFGSALRVGQKSEPQAQGVENDGNAPLSITGVVPDANAATDTGTTSCGSSVLGIDVDCVIGAEFAPTVVANPLTAAISVNSLTSNSPLVISLLGASLALNTTDVTMASTPNPSTFGNSVTLVANVTTGTGTPTGSVTFLDGSTSPVTTLGKGTLNASGSTSFATTGLLPGTHPLLAVYGGDTDHGGSTSAALNQVVQARTSTVLASSANPALLTIALNLSATVTQTGITTPVSGTAPSGTVLFFDGPTALGSAQIGAGGVATLPTLLVQLGQHTLTATYTGNTFNLGSTSAALNQSVSQRQTTTALSASANPATYETAVTFMANVAVTGTPAAIATGSVQFVVDGVAQGSPVALNSSGAASFTSSTITGGAHAVVASFIGSTDYAASTSATLTETVQKLPTATTVTYSPTPALTSKPVTLTATVVRTIGTGSPAGTITFKDGATLLTSTATLNGAGIATFAATLASGSHAISASYSGDMNDAASTGTLATLQVQQVTSMTLLANPNPSLLGSPVVFTVTVPKIGTSPLATGAIQFTDGAAVLGTGSLTASATASTASLTTSALTAGTHTITATYAGDSSYQSAIATASQIVQRSSSATLSANTNPSIAGAPIIVTMTATGSVHAPTGPIRLLDGGVPIATPALAATGPTTASVALTTSALAAGTHMLTAFYPGDTNNAAATSATWTQTVQQAHTSVVVTAVDGSSPIAGKLTTLTAVVTGNGGTPTGPVQFFDGALSLGTATLNGGSAMLGISSLIPGGHSITAVYGGDTNDLGSTSAALTLNVQRATTTLTLASSVNPVVVTLPLTLVATVNGNGGTPTGNVTVSLLGIPLATVPLNASGIASFPLLSLPIGASLVSARYEGDTDNAPATGGLTQMIQKATPNLTMHASVNPSKVGDALTFTVAAARTAGALGGSVLFTADGAPLGTATLGANGAASLTTTAVGFGTHVISASYSDADNTPSQTAPWSQTVQQETTTQLITSKSLSLGGTPVTFTANVLAKVGAPTGNVQFSDNGRALGSAVVSGGVATYSTTTLGVGAHTITAAYMGDTLDIASASAAVTQTVQAAGVTAQLSASASPAVFATTIAFTATLINTGATPSGTFTFSDNGQTLGMVQISAAGVAVLSTSTLPAGGHTILATYSGDPDNVASAPAMLTELVQAQSTITLASSANPSLATGTIVFTAQVTGAGTTHPVGTITFKDGTSILGTATLSSAGAATYSTVTLSAGAHPITAVYGGDSLDLASTSAVLTQTVQAIPTITHLTASAQSVTTGQQLTLISVVTSSGTAPFSGTVTFNAGATVLGSSPVDSSGTASLNPGFTIGSDTITATYSGDSYNGASTSLPLAITVTQATDYTLGLSAGTLSMATTQDSTVTLTLQSSGGFADTVGLGCASLPFSVTCAFSQDSVKLAANGTATVKLTINTASPLSSGSTARNEAPGARETAVLSCMVPGAALFGWLLWSSRRRVTSLYGRLLLWALVAALGSSSLLLSGCNGLTSSGATAGSYLIQVTGTGASTGIAHAADLTITVTK